jgi:uncharacterized membrane protein YfcA
LEALAGLLPEGLGVLPAVILVIASFFTSALTATFGVGGGIAMLGLMGLFLPVAALIPVHGAVQLGSNTGRAWHQRAHIRHDIAVPFLVGSLVGAIAGVFFVIQLPDALLKLVLGLFIIAVFAAMAIAHPVLMRTAWDARTHDPFAGYSAPAIEREVVEEVQDWRPFDYFTVDLHPPMPLIGPLRITTELEETADGTRVTERLIPLGGLKARAIMPLFKRMYVKASRESY